MSDRPESRRPPAPDDPIRGPSVPDGDADPHVASSADGAPLTDVDVPLPAAENATVPGSRLLPREEYVEQRHFFRAFRERLEDSFPMQEILEIVHPEILATTKLPFAVDFLRGEVRGNRSMHEALARLPHYFTPFQAFVVSQAEEDRTRFELRTALEILERQAEYLAGAPSAAGLFVFQLECLARNRLGYETGLEAVADDPMYDAAWRAWIRRARFELGSVDVCDLIYFRSRFYVELRRRLYGQIEFEPAYPVLFGSPEGRIARANRGRDPLFMFAALQRQLGYPSVPRPPRGRGPALHPELEQRLQTIEKRLKLLEAEQSGGIDLSEFYVKPPALPDDDFDFTSTPGQDGP